MFGIEDCFSISVLLCSTGVVNKLKTLFKYHLAFLAVLLLISSQIFSAGNLNKEGDTEFYSKGMKALSRKDTASAEKYFEESIKQFADAPSLVQLGKIYLNKNTFGSRKQALENFKLAVMKSPDNIEYRYHYAKLMEDFSKCTALCEYQKIVEMDVTQSEAWLGMARIKDESFTEYNHSGTLLSDDFFASLQEYANEDFYEAEKYYNKALIFEPLNYDALLKLAQLYDKAGKSGKGIPYLLRLVDNNKADKDVYLCLGLLSYRTKKMEDAYGYYKKALELMSYEERTDFTFNSVKFMVRSTFENLPDKLDDAELKKLIEIYWKVYDPSYLTDYNERLLEHYSRVAYANLYFSVPKMGKVGWKTDRGEVMLRFGEPLTFTRIRPQMGGKSVLMKTEVWNYANGLVFGFTDFASSGNYQFSIPPGERDKLKPQFLGDSQYLIENARRIYPSSYDPKFEGPKFDAPYSIVQFRDPYKNYLTDLYVNYGFNVSDSALTEKQDYSHEAGIFLFNKYYDDIYRSKENVNVNLSKDFFKQVDSTRLFINSMEAKLQPDSGTISFEIMRTADKGISSNRDSIKINSFPSDRLGISDLLFGYDVERGKSFSNMISRKGLNIIPNPSNSFSSKDSMFLYFEIYNLDKNNNNMTDFDQEVTITNADVRNRSGFESAVKSVLTFLKLSEEDQKTSLTSHYNTFETDPQIYFQLDMSKYPAGDYLVIITITDNVSKKRISRETVLKWKG